MLHTVSGVIRVGFSQSIAKISASDEIKSQEGDRGLQVVWRSINEQQQSIQNLIHHLETIQPQL